MKNKIVSYDKIVKMFRDEMSIMIGGFTCVGTPDLLVQAVLDSGVKDITMITNDPGWNSLLPPPDSDIAGCAKILTAHRVKKLITSYIGFNKEAFKLYDAGELELELVPQGTFAERIRAGGSGLGGVITPTGVGTEVAENKQILTIDGKEYLLEMPLRADIALIRGSVVDPFGNIYYAGTTRNFNPLMAMAADVVVVAAEKMVGLGEIEPENIVTPGVVVDYIVEGEHYE